MDCETLKYSAMLPIHVIFLCTDCFEIFSNVNQNIFWNIAGTDVYNALSFDVLHAYDAGLFKVHLLEEAKGLIDKMGLDAERKVEAA